jgi:hypothetical protein
MESITRNVRDLDHTDRSALERVVGHELRETQQVIVNIVNIGPGTKAASSNGPSIPPWGNIYDGLSEAEVHQLDSAIRQRVNLTRAAG